MTTIIKPRPLYGTNRARYIVEQQRIIDALARPCEHKLKGLLTDYTVDIVNAQLGMAGKVSNHDLNAAMARAITSTVADAGKKYARTTQKQIDAATRKQAKKSDGFEEIDDVIDRGISRYIGSKIKLISATTFENARAYIATMRKTGATIDQISSSIREHAQNISAYRAHVIARTESSAAAHLGQLATAQASDVEFEREWISTQDSRTRTFDNSEFDHSEADGQRVGQDEAFIVSGEELMHPCDPSGSAGNVIMCRCGVGLVVV